MEETNNNKLFYDKMCSFCVNKDSCNHDKFTEEKFYNGITTRRCVKYKYIKEVE